RRSDERQRLRITVVAPAEISIERRDDRIGFTRRNIFTLPLTDAGSASIRQNDAADLFQSLQLSVAFNCLVNLFGTGCDHESRLDLETLLSTLFGNAGRSGHIFIGRISA